MPKVSIKDAPQASEAAPDTPFDALEPGLGAGELDEDGPPKPKTPTRSYRTVPKPPHFKYGTDRPKGQKPDAFFSWWTSLSDDIKGMLVLYVYRNWPVWRVMSEKTKKFSSQIDKVSGDDAILDVDDFQHRYGAGDYTLRLNDQVVLKKTIAMCTITGLRDLENHPPVIHDLSGLVLDDPQNRDYIGFLRLKGVRIPGVTPLVPGEEVEDVAGNEALSSMIEANRELTDRLLDTREPEPPAKLDPGMQGANMGMEIVKAGADMANNMLTSAMTRVTELTSKQEDPTAMVKNLVDIARSMNPEPKAAVPDPMVAAMLEESKQLRSQLYDSQKTQVEMLRQELAAARVAGMNPQLQQPLLPGQTPGFQPQMLDGLDKLMNVLDRLKKSFGGGEEELERAREAPTSMWATILPMAIPAFTGIMAMLSNMMYNYAASKMSREPQAPPQLPQGAYTPEQLAELAAGQPVTGQPQPQGENGGGDMGNPYTKMLAELKEPLLRALNNPDVEEGSHPGADFAYLLMQWKGRMAYDALRELGKDVIVQLLHTYPPIWTEVVKTPQKFSTFLDEFLAYDQLMADQDRDEEIELGAGEMPPEAEFQPPTPAPRPKPAVKVRKVKTINVKSVKPVDAVSDKQLPVDSSVAETYK
jgi:hypothetical protein